MKKRVNIELLGDLGFPKNHVFIDFLGYANPWGGRHNKQHWQIAIPMIGSFDYYCPEYDTSQPEDLALSAINCFLGDAITAIDNNFESFCSDFGYDNDSIAALKIFKACQKQAKKAAKVFSPDQIAEIYSKLGEIV